MSGLLYAERSKSRGHYGSITPFGQAGPYQDYKFSDLIASAIGGLSYICGDSDRPPVHISAEQAYAHAGAQAAVATLIANQYRHIAGEGQHIDVSIQECIVWTLMYTIPYWDFGKRPFSRSGNLQSRYGVSYRLIYPCIRTAGYLVDCSRARCLDVTSVLW